MMDAASVIERASGACELCDAVGELRALALAPHVDVEPETAVAVCSACAAQLDGSAELDVRHLFCLQQSVWSEVPAVQVASWRLLTRVAVTETWAADLQQQVWLPEEVLAWATQGDGEAGDSDRAPTVDSNGTPLADGDAVTIIKDLDVKGTSFVAKRGTMVKGIRLTDNPEHVEGKVNGVQIVLKTMFLKRAG